MNSSSRKWEHCRMCGLHKTYGDLLDLTADGKTYIEFLEIFGYLKIDFVDLSEANTLPKTVCERCYDAIQDASKFFHTINKSQYILKNISKSYKPDSSLCNVVTAKERSVIHEAIHRNNQHSIAVKSEKEGSKASLPQDTTKPHLIYCRFCAVQKSSWEVTDFSEYNIYVKYERLLGYFKVQYVELRSSKLPKTCCLSCNNSLEKAYTYFNKVQVSQTVLDSLYGAIPDGESNKVNVHEKCATSSLSNNTKECQESELNLQNTQKSDTNPQNTIPDQQNTIPDQQNTIPDQQKDHQTPESLQTTNDLQNPQETHQNPIKVIREAQEDLISLQDLQNLQSGFQIPHEVINKPEQSVQSLDYQSPVTTLQRVDDGGRPEALSNLGAPATFSSECGGPVQEVGLEAVNDVVPLSCCAVDIGVDYSWTSYPWQCGVCETRVTSSCLLRAHGKAAHQACAVTVCADCRQPYGCYQEFIRHVREHRAALSIYCEYCNMCLPSVQECEAHVASHLSGTQNICELCGEVLPYVNTLEWHRRLYGRGGARGEYRRQGSGGWDHYPYTCHECGFVPASLTTLRQHCIRSHSVCLSVTCADCGRRCKDYNTFIDHARGHRPHLRHYCQYCNESFDEVDLLNEHVLEHITSQQRPCHLCGQVFDDNKILAAHKKQYAKKTPRNKQTQKTKPHNLKTKNKKIQPQNVVIPDDLTCVLCSKVLKTPLAYRRHAMIHQTRERSFVCSTCGKGFLSKNTLKEHVKTHSSLKAEVCQVCQKRFHTRPKLKAHILTHSELRPFVCDTCGASFKLRRRLKSHMKSHSNEKPFKCSYCYKDFKFKENLKTHEYQHTGERPYCCEFCERTFTNWTNCNKHMIRKHGVTLARTKITSQGRLAVDRRTGEAPRLPVDAAATEWMHQTLQHDKRTRHQQRDCRQ